MFELIIIAIVLIIVVAAFKQLLPEERNIVAKSAVNVTGVTAVYAFKAVRGTVRTAWDIGSIAGMKASLEQQETLTDLDKFNKEMTAKGGATKEAIRINNSHADTLGIIDMQKSLAETKAKIREELAAARAARA
jgi:hypothetical protein